MLGICQTFPVFSGSINVRLVPGEDNFPEFLPARFAGGRNAGNEPLSGMTGMSLFFLFPHARDILCLPYFPAFIRAGKATFNTSKTCTTLSLSENCWWILPLAERAGRGCPFTRRIPGERRAMFCPCSPNWAAGPLSSARWVMTCSAKCSGTPSVRRVLTIRGWSLPGKSTRRLLSSRLTNRETVTFPFTAIPAPT